MERWQEFLSGLFGNKSETKENSPTVSLVEEKLGRLGTNQLAGELEQGLPASAQIISNEPMSPDTQQKYELMLWVMKSYLGVDYGHSNSTASIDCSQLVGQALRNLGLLKPSFQTSSKLANSFFNYYIEQWAQVKNPEQIKTGDLVFRYEGEKDSDNHPEDIVYHVALATSDAQQEGEDIFISTIESTTDGSFDGVKEFPHRKMQQGWHYAIDREIVYNTVLEDASYAWSEKPFETDGRAT